MACDGLPNKVLIRGIVTAWRPALPRMRVRAGATVAFEADEIGQARLRDRRRCGASARRTRRRKHTRIPIGIPVHVRDRRRAGGDRRRAARDQRQRRPVYGASSSRRSAPTSSWRSRRPAARRRSTFPGASSTMPATNQTGVRFIYREGGGSRRLAGAGAPLQGALTSEGLHRDPQDGSPDWSSNVHAIRWLASALLVAVAGRRGRVASHYAVGDVPAPDHARARPRSCRRRRQHHRGAAGQGRQGQGSQGAGQGVGLARPRAARRWPALRPAAHQGRRAPRWCCCSRPRA